MKKFLFLMLSAAVAVSASAGITNASLQKKVRVMNTNTSKVELVRVANGDVVSTPAPQFRAPAKLDIPEGYAAVTLNAGDVWGDGSGYQLLLDADATAYGTIIPETGPLTSSGDASDEVYAEFEYKIPENADGACSTQNIIINNFVTIMIPAGTYDWCITNPTPGSKIWIASGNGDGGRADDYLFEAGNSYLFTMTLDEESGNDMNTITVNGDLPRPYPQIPELTVTPAATSANVAWGADEDADGWNLRWRPWVDIFSGTILYDFPYDTDILAIQLDDWYTWDNDGDENEWDLYYTDDTHTDLIWQSVSWSSSTGALTPDNWLISPETKLEGVCQFSMRGVPAYPDHLGVYALIGWDPEAGYAPAVEDLVLIEEFDVAASEEVKTIDISSYNGQMGRIVFRHYNCDNMYYLTLDDIIIGDPNNVVSPAPWNYEYEITNNYFNIEGLTPETKYEVQVMAYNSEHESDWCDIVTFMTLADQPVGKIGDVNKDGHVKIDDVTALLDALLSGNALDETDNYSPDNANVNEDDTVNIADVTALIDLLLSGNAD